MTTQLMFEAVCNGRVFGAVVIQNSVATARLGKKVLTDVFFGHALMWLREHNPDPGHDVEFRFVPDFASRGEEYAEHRDTSQTTVRSSTVD